ncbi:MAG: mechanosensitive ion channel [Casimicrobiaceae bacterium]|nr:mechanosensitive ion channel [Casimicrobiaceae bacterium]MCX8098657.1 mechanosensitive ion channel [Casimicrobiaceae bacterium]MDW8311850.1 mechanosensitive ion channel [Burkholderiales bacterium]
MSPIERLLEEFAQIEGSEALQIALVLLALAGGALAAWFAARRRASALGEGMRSAWIQALVHGVAFPAATTAILAAGGYLLGARRLPTLVLLALTIFGSLTLLRLVAQLLRRLFPRSARIRALISWASLLVWAGIVLNALGLLAPLAEDLDQLILPLGKARVSVLALLQGLALVSLTVVAALWLSALVEARLMQLNLDTSLRLVLTRALRAVLFALALLMALAFAGIDLTVLSVFGGALGVGLGLGLQRIAANYVSGFAILLERSVRVGDVIRIEDKFEGQITDIRTRYTVVRAPNGRESIVPNETLLTQRIENLSFADRQVALTCTVTVAYASEVDRVIELLETAARTTPRVLAEPPPRALLAQFAPDGLEFSLVFWIGDPENGQLNVRSDVNRAIYAALRENGIEIPYPQRVIHPAAPPSMPASSLGASLRSH